MKEMQIYIYIYINVNSFNNCLFIIKDLEGFIGNIKENIKVNQSP